MVQFDISDPYLKKIVYAVGIMGVIAFGFYTFSLLRGLIDIIFTIINPFILAFILSYIMAPVVIALQKQLKLGRVMGLLVLYMLIALVILFFLVILIPNLIEQLIALINFVLDAFPRLLHQVSSIDKGQLRDWLPAGLPFFDSATTDTLTSGINSATSDTLTSATLAIADAATSSGLLSSNGASGNSDFISFLQYKLKNTELDYENLAASLMPLLKNLFSGGLSAAGGVAGGIFSGLGAVISFVSFLIFVGIINFYLILDWEKIGPLFRKMVPPEHREKTFKTLTKVDRAVGGFLRGQLTVSVVVGSLFALGLFVIGLLLDFPTLSKYSILIGTAAAIGGFIPYLGAIIGVTPALLIVLLTPDQAIGSKVTSIVAVIILFSLIQTIEGFVLQPKIVGKGAGLHPLVVLLALLAGAQFGIGGMIIAVPVAGVIRVLVREYYWLPLLEREKELQREKTSEA